MEMAPETREQAEQWLQDHEGFDDFPADKMSDQDLIDLVEVLMLAKHDDEQAALAGEDEADDDDEGDEPEGEPEQTDGPAI